jgi:hypothetical protein
MIIIGEIDPQIQLLRCLASVNVTWLWKMAIEIVVFPFEHGDVP